MHRYLGHLIRALKSKRHAEANLMARYRNLGSVGSVGGAGPLDALKNELNDVAPCRAPSPPDSFPLRSRGKICALSAADCEDLHTVFLRYALYRRVCQEWTRAHPGDSNPGYGIQTWKPWLAKHQESKAFSTRNPASLGDALQIFQVKTYRAGVSGVWHAGEKRSGCGTPSAPHSEAQSVFQFIDGDTNQFGRIMCMFFISVKLPGDDVTSIIRLAKVQVLDFVTLDAKSHHPVVSMQDNNLQSLITMDRIGPVIVCAHHPGIAYGGNHFLILPWPRKRGAISS
jgi:hypothetical protein